MVRQDKWQKGLRGREINATRKKVGARKSTIIQDFARSHVTCGLVMEEKGAKAEGNQTRNDENSRRRWRVNAKGDGPSCIHYAIAISSEYLRGVVPELDRVTDRVALIASAEEYFLATRRQQRPYFFRLFSFFPPPPNRTEPLPCQYRDRPNDSPQLSDVNSRTLLKR